MMVLPKAARLHPAFSTLMRNLKAVGGDVPGSPYARGKYVNTLRGMHRRQKRRQLDGFPSDAPNMSGTGSSPSLSTTTVPPLASIVEMRLGSIIVDGNDPSLASVCVKLCNSAFYAW